ncbi:MAG: hypothetical protein ACRDCY_18285 [Aeromonas veronii]
MNMKELLALVVQWGVDRNFPNGGTKQGQVCKLAEEWGKEACANILASDREKFKDDIGDQVVVLAMLGLSAGVDPQDIVNRLGNVLQEQTGSGLAGNFWYAQDKTQLPWVHVYQMALGISQELGTLAEAVVKGADVSVTILNYAAQLQAFCDYVGVNVFESLQVAYSEIKDRKGSMVDGAFIKESDLPPADIQTAYEG